MWFMSLQFILRPGLLVDSSKRFFGVRRPVFISFIATAFIVSQLTAFYTSEIDQLWKASVLLGLSYGSSVALFPSITIDWFGLGEHVFGLLRCSIFNEGTYSPFFRELGIRFSCPGCRREYLLDRVWENPGCAFVYLFEPQHG